MASQGDQHPAIPQQRILCFVLNHHYDQFVFKMQEIMEQNCLIFCEQFKRKSKDTEYNKQCHTLCVTSFLEQNSNNRQQDKQQYYCKSDSNSTEKQNYNVTLCFPTY